MSVLYGSMNRLLAAQPKLLVTIKEQATLHKAVQAASQSTVPQFKMAAIVTSIYNDKTLCKTNRVGEHYVQTRWRPLTTHVHAEIACLIAASPRQMQDGTIYVARQKKDGTPSCSYPCVECFNALLSTKLRYLVCYNEIHQPVRIDLRTKRE